MKTAHRQAAHAKRRIQADPLAMYRVLGRVSPFTVEEQNALNLPIMLALDGIARGKGVEDDFHTLASAVNIAMVCAEKISPLVEETCTTARDALMRMHGRYLKHGTWAFDGPGYTAIREAADVYQQLTSLLTGGQLKQAMVECMQRMKVGEVMEPTV